MTTIVYSPKEGIVVSDSQETTESRKLSCKKLYRCEGHIIACTGGTYAALRFVHWFDDYAEGNVDWEDAPDLTNLELDEDFECLVVRPDGTAYTVSRLMAPAEVEDITDFFTLGSGGSAAMAALRAGANARKAVRIACEIDAWSGGKLQVMKV